jgi:hypothetical protein
MRQFGNALAPRKAARNQVEIDPITAESENVFLPRRANTYQIVADQIFGRNFEVRHAGFIKRSA